MATMEVAWTPRTKWRRFFAGVTIFAGSMALAACEWLWPNSVVSTTLALSAAAFGFAQKAPQTQSAQRTSPVSFESQADDKQAPAHHPSAPNAVRQPVVALTSNMTHDDDNLRLLKQHDELLKSGRDRFSKIPGYTATLYKRERIGSSISDGKSLLLKVRHEPFSVYVKWLDGGDAGKEVLYVDGTNDGQLLVRLGGFKGRLLPAFKIDPYGSRALSESRYPITHVGILALADSLLAHRELEIQHGAVPRVHCEPDTICQGRHCRFYVIEFSDAQQSPDYRKSIQYMDREWNVPLQVENYGWPEAGQQLAGAALDEATLIEYYMYSAVAADVQLTDGDFDRANAEYHFRR
jgi:hypothetical protein